jgi:hypothetical protein
VCESVRSWTRAAAARTVGQKSVRPDHAGQHRRSLLVLDRNLHGSTSCRFTGDCSRYSSSERRGEGRGGLTDVFGYLRCFLVRVRLGSRRS